MKKNLLSIIMLALLIVNIVLTSIMMFSIMGVTKKTSALITDISSVLQLEISGPSVEGETEAVSVSMADTAVYKIAEPLTINLKEDGDTKGHFCIVTVALSMNMKDKGYKKFGAAETMAGYQPVITGEINDIIGQYTIDELRDSSRQEEVRQEILVRIQQLFESEFIYSVSFSDIKFQ